MGCNSSCFSFITGNAKEKSVPKLSLVASRFVDGDANDEDRGVLTELNKANLMEILQSAAGESGRKWSIGSQSDNGRRSFSNKMVEKAGQIPQNLQSEGIGFACKKGLKPESPNQDSWFILKVEDDFSIYAVFDGHGQKGHDVSQFVKESLPKIMIRDDRFKTETEVCLSEAFRKVQAMIETATRTKQINATMSGTTASVIVHRHIDNMLFIAHCGNSRCALAKRKGDGDGWKVIPLTEDHKPNLLEEKQRIERNGGQVTYDGFANHRVYARGHRYPGLSISRALGDLMGYYDAGISADPTVKAQQLNADDEILIMGTKGVWAFIDEKEAANIIKPFGPDKATADAEKLAKDAWDRWIENEGGMVVEDITTLVIWVNK